MTSENIATDLEPLPCSNGDSCRNATLLADLQQQLEQLQTQVRTDALTGLFNYRFLAEILPLEMERTRRTFAPLAVILLDIDHFKVFNDRHGHEAGNRALVHLAGIAQQALRKLDYACRFGGEEFVFILPNTDLRQAVGVAERLRELIATSCLRSDQGAELQLTASLGVEVYLGRQMETPEQFLERADAWLYQAKAEGRNCVAHPLLEEAPAATQVTQEEKDILFGAFTNKD